MSEIMPYSEAVDALVRVRGFTARDAYRTVDEALENGQAEHAGIVVAHHLYEGYTITERVSVVALAPEAAYALWSETRAADERLSFGCGAECAGVASAEVSP